LFYCITPTERHAKCLEIAVENGAEVNNISKEGIPVLMFACETASENEDTCVLLMEKGAEPNGGGNRNTRRKPLTCRKYTSPKWSLNSQH
jgi:hypothetical protein